MSRSIPFNRFSGTGAEFQYVRRAIESMHISGDGQFTRSCQALLEELLGVPKVLLTTSCTHALEMAALLLDLREGDEVILPSFTFVSTANAFVLRGCVPVFVDIRPDTLNLDERLVEAKITGRTKAIVPVHYGGVGCAMDPLFDIAERHGIEIVEDNAHGLFGSYRGKALGTFGSLATLSFHETKNISCGEGGALLINDPKYIERAEVLREKGTDRSRFFRGEIDKYSWVDVGSSYLPSDILAAFLYAQLESREQIQDRRRTIWNTYALGLCDWARREGTRLPCIPSDRESAWHLFHLITPSQEYRRSLIEHLRSRDIHAVFHYLPLHTSGMGQRFGGREGDCAVCEDVSDRLLRLPFYNALSDDDQHRVIDAVCEFHG